MRNNFVLKNFFVVAGLAAALVGLPAIAQAPTGSLEITAQITPTGGRPEPIREFPLFVLTKSYEDIISEVEASDPLPTQSEFIDSLLCSPELKTWMKDHRTIDLAAVDFDKLLTPDSITTVPEFLAAYQRTNSGGVTVGLPTPHYHESDKATNPEKYEKSKQEYLAALRKFIQANASTISGTELELSAINPKTKWDRLYSDRRNHLAQVAPDLAQTKYLAGHVETDLDGHAGLARLAPAQYWISSLGVDAASGDRHYHWDTPVKIQSGQVTRIVLSNVNGINGVRTSR